MLCCAADTLTEFTFCPIVRRRGVPFPADLAFVVAVSGVLAEKTGAALESYNRASLTARAPSSRRGTPPRAANTRCSPTRSTATRTRSRAARRRRPRPRARRAADGIRHRVGGRHPARHRGPRRWRPRCLRPAPPTSPTGTPTRPSATRSPRPTGSRPWPASWAPTRRRASDGSGIVLASSTLPVTPSASALLVGALPRGFPAVADTASTLVTRPGGPARRLDWATR